MCVPLRQANCNALMAPLRSPKPELASDSMTSLLGTKKLDWFIDASTVAILVKVFTMLVAATGLKLPKQCSETSKPYNFVFCSIYSIHTFVYYTVDFSIMLRCIFWHLLFNFTSITYFNCSSKSNTSL